MGMFDYVQIAADLTGSPLAGQIFQTKAFHCRFDRYTINKAGRLIRHSFRYEPNNEATASVLQMKPIPTGDDDTEFHGDMRLTADTRPFQEYAARFTHGTLEWIRPWAELPEHWQSISSRSADL